MSAPTKAFILAAGLGTRLRPATDHIPKPMAEVAGQSLITRTLDKLLEASVRDVTVNLHYLADVLKKHLEEYRAGKDLILHYSYEEELLDTGGGIRKVLPHFDDEPFYVIAGDALWQDAPGENALRRLAQHWDDKTMDVLTLLQPLETMRFTRGIGDYDLDEKACPLRRADKSGAYMWTNIRLNHPRIFKDQPEGVFSFLPLMDAAQETGRLQAMVHKGDWYHISTPEDLKHVNAAFKRRKEGA